MCSRLRWKEQASAKTKRGQLQLLTLRQPWQSLPIKKLGEIAMNEEAVRKFCEYRHRPLIVIAGTFVAGLLLVLPLVDVYYAGRNEKTALEGELDSARSMASNSSLDARVSEKLAQLAALEARTVNDD